MQYVGHQSVATDVESPLDTAVIRLVPALRGVQSRFALVMRWIRSRLLLAVVVAVVTAVSVLWRVLETRPPHVDMAYHLTNSLFYLHDSSLGDPVSFLGAYRYYPPLTYWVTDVFYVVLGNEAMWVAVLSNAVWLSILVFATYGVGRRLWSTRVGWV